MKCNCQKTAVTRTVKKEGTNCGRKFLSCGQNRKCNFFKWLDSAPAISEMKNVNDLEINLNKDLDLTILKQRFQLPIFHCEVVSENKFQKFLGKTSDEMVSRPKRNCVKLMDCSEKLHGFTKDDLWILSTSPFFKADPRAKIVLCRSSWSLQTFI